MSRPRPQATCADCRHWFAVPRSGGEKTGECRVGPPDVLLKVGPVMGYRQTFETLPACGAFAAR